jgi:hypothetical protein
MRTDEIPTSQVDRDGGAENAVHEWELEEVKLWRKLLPVRWDRMRAER